MTTFDQLLKKTAKPKYRKRPEGFCIRSYIDFAWKNQSASNNYEHLW